MRSTGSPFLAQNHENKPQTRESDYAILKVPSKNFDADNAIFV